MSAIRLRPATLDDEEFCFQLHRATLRPYVEPIWGWDNNLQRSMHRQSFDVAHTQIITVDSIEAGSFTVDRRADEIYLGRIEIEPAHQGRGIGRRLIGQLLEEAAVRNQPVVLDVLHTNMRAYALYVRLGFREVGRHGVSNRKIRLNAYPSGITGGRLYAQ